MWVFYQAKAGGIESLVESPEHDLYKNYKLDFLFVKNSLWLSSFHHRTKIMLSNYVVFVIVINLLVSPIETAMNALKALSLVRQLETIGQHSYRTGTLTLSKTQGCLFLFWVWENILSNTYLTIAQVLYNHPRHRPLRRQCDCNLDRAFQGSLMWV